MHARMLLLALLTCVLMSAQSDAYNLRQDHFTSQHRHYLQSHPLLTWMNRGAQATSPDGVQSLVVPKAQIEVDGSKNPALVSDELAYRHFLRATSSSGSAADIKRRNFMLARAGLSVEESLEFISALEGLGAELAAVSSQRRTQGSMMSRASLATLKDIEDELFSDAHARIKARMSPAALAKLDSHVNDYIKRRIVVFGFSMK